MTIVEWRKFLQQWSEEWLARDESFPAPMRKARWLGSRGATENQVARLEKRLGYRLPPSYRNFLLVSNGWSRTSDFIQRVRPTSKVKWLQTDDPQLADLASEQDGPFDGVSPAEYFSYDLRPFFDKSHLRESLIIADPVPGDSMVYLLNPLVVAQNGEWEAWRFAHWIPGAERFPSFELLMRAEYEAFRGDETNDARTCGPYEGVYAPDRARTKATAIRKVRPKPPRLTVPQLINQLESSDKKARLTAAKQLLREFCSHDPQNEHPELIEPLSRIVRSKLETDVRCAAVAMLGSYGTVDAIPLLIQALGDRGLRASSLASLFYISIDIRDSRTADAVLNLLNDSRDYFVVGESIKILEELKDPRLAEPALRILDHADEIEFGVPPTAENAVGLAHQRSFLRMQAAFAFARFAMDPVPPLLARLAHPNPGIREAAVAALREIPNPPADLSKHVNRLLQDRDSAVRQQAEMTFQHLHPRPEVHLSPERMAEVMMDADAFIKRAMSRKKNRF